jgi:hypothetical protein
MNRSWADGLLLAAMAINIACAVWLVIATRRMQRINAALFLTLTLAWTMRGWHIDLSDDARPRYSRKAWSWISVPRSDNDGA